MDQNRSELVPSLLQSQINFFCPHTTPKAPSVWKNTYSPWSCQSIPITCLIYFFPAGQEHVVPKSGFFCNICSIFYLTEKAAKEVHCSSQRHYENLQVGQNAKYSTTKDEYLMFMHFFPHQNHYKKLQWKSSRTQSSHGSLSDWLEPETSLKKHEKWTKRRIFV